MLGDVWPTSLWQKEQRHNFETSFSLRSARMWQKYSLFRIITNFEPSFVIALLELLCMGSVNADVKSCF